MDFCDVGDFSSGGGDHCMSSSSDGCHSQATDSSHHGDLSGDSLFTDSNIQTDQAVPVSEALVRRQKKKNLPLTPYNGKYDEVMTARPVTTVSGPSVTGDKTVTLNGLQYSSNVTLPKTRKAPKYFQDVVIKDSKDTIIGTKINTSDLVINQHVDLTQINPSDKVNLTEGGGQRWCYRLRYLWVTIILGVIITGAVVAASTVFSDNSSDQEDPDDDTAADDVPTNYTQRLIRMAQWSHHQGVTFPKLPHTPARYVVVCHSVSAFCKNTATCQQVVASMDAWALQEGWVGIAYNFLIGGDGYIYEGRGWNKLGAHTRAFNCHSVGVAFVGNFDRDKLLPSMIEAYNILIEEGVRRKALAPDYQMFGAYQIKSSTDSPGVNIKKELRSWPHWALVSDNVTFCL